MARGRPPIGSRSATGISRFARALFAARLAYGEHGISQDELGKRVIGKRLRGRPHAFIGQLERDERKPSLVLAGDIARALGLPSLHFSEAIFHDMSESQCRPHEVTRIVVGLQTYVRNMSREQWDEWVALRSAR